jgi:hypothetical protein
MIISLFCAFLVGHAIADYPLQGDFLSKAKNRANPIPGVPWYQAMGAHAVIHGGFVGLIAQLVAGLWWIGILEAIAHFIIDDRKCAGKLTYNQDQALHILCKILWILVIFLVYI